MSTSGVLTAKRKCSPFRFSNDKWSPRAVQKLQAMVHDQQTPLEQSAALTVGSGGLPYLLSHWNTRRVFGIDLSDDVLATTAWRTSQLIRFDNWEDYHYGIESGLAHRRTPQRHNYVDEFLNAEESGFQGDYSRAREVGSTTEFTFIRSDLRVIAPHIGRLAAQEGREFTFVNFTNVANYTGFDRTALRTVLDAIPVADEAIIIDSAPTLCPEVYSLADYRNLVPTQ